MNQYKDHGGLSMGPENLGVPICEESDALVSPFGTTGRYQNFSKNSQITAIELITSGSKKGNAFVVLPGIFKEFKNQGYSRGNLGFPIRNEMKWMIYYIPVGIKQDFEGGYIYYAENYETKTILKNNQNQYVHVLDVDKNFIITIQDITQGIYHFLRNDINFGLLLDAYILFVNGGQYKEDQEGFFVPNRYQAKIRTRNKSDQEIIVPTPSSDSNCMTERG